jgi:hypothetical protein
VLARSGIRAQLLGSRGGGIGVRAQLLGGHGGGRVVRARLIAIVKFPMKVLSAILCGVTLRRLRHGLLVPVEQVGCLDRESQQGCVYNNIILLFWTVFFIRSL